ncbi:MAG TPA: hypothetical protein VGG51_13785 [Candidatus Cybelea sp.]|jgi:hypothetical protein
MNGRFWRQATYAIAIAVFLSGCGSFAPSNAPSANSAVPQRAQVDGRTGSWMVPEAKSQNLLYVSAYSDVLVFTYPGGKQVGDLKGFTSAAGECVDSKGNVFITSFKPRGANEYGHGRTKRIALFPADAIPLSCAISPTTGDLAICGSASYLEIYRAAKGKPITFRDKRMQYGTLVTYDDKGDLFFLGIKPGTAQQQQLSELRSGSSHFVNVKADASIYVEGGLQWNDGLLTAISNTKKVNIYQFQISGTKAHKVGATPLGAPAYIVLQYVIDGKTVIVPNLLSTTQSNVLYYRYPEGGAPTFTLSGSGGARAVAVSRAAS